MNNTSVKGFTLSEIVIVVVIIGVIASFALPNYFRGIQKQNERKAATDIQQLAAGVQNWQAATTAGSFTTLTNLNTINSTFGTDIMLDPGWAVTMNANQTAYLLSITFDDRVVSLGNQTNTDVCCESDNCLTMPDC